MGIISENNTTEPDSPAPFKQRFTLSTLEMIFGVLILLGLVYMGYFILFQDSSGTHQLDKKLKSVENYFKEHDEKIDKKFKALQDNWAQLELRLKKIEERQTQTENNYRELSTRITKTPKATAEPKKPAAASKEKIEYKVKKGDNLASIAKKYKVTREDLAKWNKIDKNKPLQAGEVLIVIPR
ncbi:MAG TPA: LysM peptidoglycan-binding domain-containing protein [Thermodesulfobacteriota bacterium]|nr:LysM peptidoglycan-binding domain-containing protein [Thermodesulfobacteriota bacterium]